jgi:hypothetical protein
VWTGHSDSTPNWNDKQRSKTLGTVVRDHEEINVLGQNLAIGDSNRVVLYCNQPLF